MAAQEPPRESARRAAPVPPPATTAVGPSSFGDDIQTVMAVLRGIKRGDLGLRRDLRACRNTDEKLLVLVRYHHLMVRTGPGRTVERATNIEATGCRLAMTDHSVLVIVSVYLPPSKVAPERPQSPLRLRDAVIPFRRPQL
ncbi:hypothetical protein EVAR_64904_1 [Eumeta japonica]|uniref:Uncharacterized protein n=1 Tax=Eumeta variegata TaxID=151549 RepID=A0A4C1ZX52_EUMVA|nr:hypothetical protein EVAR_64904_1 [Eumeta japonica]